MALTAETTAAPAVDRIHAGQPVVADRIHDYDNHLIGLTLDPNTARSLIHDLLRTAMASDLVRHGLIDTLTRKPDVLTDHTARGAIDRLLHIAGQAGDLTITLDPVQAETLAEQLDVACVEPETCRCGRYVESQFTVTCGPCQDGGRW